MKPGDKVKLVNTLGLWGYGWSRYIKKNKTYTVRRVKSTGGILLEEFQIGFSNPEFASGDEQGLMAYRFELVKSKKKPKKKYKKQSSKKK